ncbi:MAG: helix-turn-helix transcriptional regulator [Bdellovibrionales bacterium]|nr:helix-turn-helix transcriptional regulator [Bdellovibrionales bacterium]
MKLGANLSAVCKQKGISLAELARRAGVPKQTLHNWTLGRRSVNVEQLQKVARVLEVSVHFLLYGEQDPFESLGEEVLRELFSGDVRVTVHRIDRRRRR